MNKLKSISTILVLLFVVGGTPGCGQVVDSQGNCRLGC